MYKEKQLVVPLYTVGLTISQWLPCPLAIWNLLFGVVILFKLVKLGNMCGRLGTVCRLLSCDNHNETGEPLFVSTL